VVTVVRDGAAKPKSDQLAAEEPMEVRLGGERVAVTMRTPGDDFELAAGFCRTEGLIDPGDEISSIRYCAGTDEHGRQTYNVVDLSTRAGATPAPELTRSVYTTSSCGICGTASIDAVRKNTSPVGDDPLTVGMATVAGIPDTLRRAQRVFAATGGLHAAGIFDADGNLQCVREDVGRHNAVDKAIGWAALGGHLPLEGRILAVSGRLAFEIVQKALIAGMPMVTAVSAPSSLAVELAEESGMTLVGFLRGSSANLYTGGQRVLTT